MTVDIDVEESSLSLDNSSRLSDSTSLHSADNAADHDDSAALSSHDYTVRSRRKAKNLKWRTDWNADSAVPENVMQGK